MKLTLERQIPLVFAIAIILLIIVVLFAFRSMGKLTGAVSSEKHTLEVISHLDETLNLIVDAETGTRGFIITKDETILEPYNRAKQKVDEVLPSLRELIKDNPNQTERVSRLENIIDERLGVLEQAIGARRTSLQDSVEAIRDKLAGNRGRQLMDEARLVIGEMKDEERNLLAQRESDLDRSVTNTYRMLYLISFAGILSLGIANFAVFREITKRRKAEDKLRDANKDLEGRVEKRTNELSQKNVELEEQMRQREQSENRHRLALEAGNLGTWIFDTKEKRAEIDERSLSLFGFSADDFDENTFSRIYLEDLPRVEKLLQKSLKENTNFNAEFRVGTADGTIRWTHCTGQPQLDENGEVIRIVGNCRDITESKEAESVREELFKKEQSARKDAEIANRLRDEFLATVSHELRAPLNSILGWGRLLEKGNLDEKTTQKALDTIIRNAEAQNRLIEDLLDVSRIISGKLRLEIMNIKPSNFVEAALETVRPAAEAKGITLEVKEEMSVSHLSGDPNRLQQVIWNLLSNAIKFTPNGGTVTVEAERVNGCIEIRVKDTGIGIKEEFLPHVFDRFRQADASSIRKFGGLGLGLAIVRHLTEMHGGTVRVVSEGENLGSTFIISLPVTSSQPQDLENQGISGTMILEDESKISLDGLLILVVDDEDDTRQLLVQSLTFYGATVVTAKSAAEGLSELIDKSPDVLVSDIGMPEEDGYSLIKKARALSDEHQKNVKAIALTAFTRAQDRMRALSAGYQNHVAKPVEPDELATVIASLTGRLQIDEI
ncbi:MAG: CHASE3 domain-containing protein [Pyrinomonadaceae bacterium]